ncbi:MAG: hypothetical protein CMJ32_08540 [Phycisphaerae bacterium]|nr:hypothetical protein [Phycisphaerae bacterium]
MIRKCRNSTLLPDIRIGFVPSAIACTILMGFGASLLLAEESLQLQPRPGDPLDGLTPVQLERFEIGADLYITPITAEAGLGPIFNKAACGSCHSTPLGGWGSISVNRFGLIDEKGKEGGFDPLVDLGGPVQQVSGLNESCLELIPAIANHQITRMTNSVLCFGLVEAIEDADLMANADPIDSNADGISGRYLMVEVLEDPKGPKRVGRFGWKTQLATVLSFSGDAANGEMGLTNRLVQEEQAPNGDQACLDEFDLVADPEDQLDSEGFGFIDRVTHFQRYLAPAPQTPKSGMTGETIFNDIGCNACHVSTFTTANDPSLEAVIRNKTFKPYGDFLLHDMGLLGDGHPQGQAGELEMRTAVLMNLRNRDPMLHNGTAAGGLFCDRITAAIAAHGPFGEGAASAAAYNALSSGDKALLCQFLDSLGRIEFDMEGDNDVDYFDFLQFIDCFVIKTTITPDDPCAICDIDQDGDVGMVDFNMFLQAFDGEIEDCNDNGDPDLLDILMGVEVDEDLNGVPDSCEACVADINGDSVVNGRDLGALLGQWDSSGPADLDQSGVVDGIDLGILLGQWGPCP